MITLAIDTSEARGSIAVLKDGVAIAGRTHNDESDYSAWLLPAVASALEKAQIRLERVDLLAVSTGPGSFTGLRVGLTTVKAWAEVYGKRVIGVSRLEALVLSNELSSGVRAACYDAQRGQVFAGLYEVSPGSLQRLGGELVISPADFVHAVDELVGKQTVTWVTLDPHLFAGLEAMERRAATGERIVPVSPELAPIIGKLAEQSAARGQFSDPLSLDANYVRRSDAELFWKGLPTLAARPATADQTQLRMRHGRKEDAPDLLAILQQSPEAARWTEKQFTEELVGGRSDFFVMQQGEEIIGFVSGRPMGEEGEILNLAMKPKSRKRGIGKTLVQQLLQVFAQKGVLKVFLEVRKSNSGAIAFYERLGFRQVRERPAYYGNPPESALILAISLPNSASTFGTH
jgi:tRNA threonylcarbamoyladenosine biosynthesis protein TsaB